jgi:hypothetical protein
MKQQYHGELVAEDSLTQLQNIAPVFIESACNARNDPRMIPANNG